MKAETDKSSESETTDSTDVSANGDPDKTLVKNRHGRSNKYDTEMRSLEHGNIPALFLVLPADKTDIHEHNDGLGPVSNAFSPIKEEGTSDSTSLSEPTHDGIKVRS